MTTDTPESNSLPSYWFMERDDGVEPLLIDHLILSFLLCLVGLSLAMTFFMLEYVQYKFSKKKCANSDSEESVELASREREDSVMCLAEI